MGNKALRNLTTMAHGFIAISGNLALNGHNKTELFAIPRLLVPSSACILGTQGISIEPQTLALPLGFVGEKNESLREAMFWSFLSAVIPPSVTQSLRYGETGVWAVNWL